MRIRLATLFFPALLFCSLSAEEPRVLRDSDDENGFKTIFNGTNLDGWTVMPAKFKKAWYVKDQVIEGNGDKGRSYLVWKEKEIADFELKFSYRFRAEGNSGVNIRAIDDPTGRRKFQSYHADLGHIGIGKNVLGAWDFHTPGRKEHGCPRGERLVIDQGDNAIRSKIKNSVTLEDIKKTGWNDAHVIAKENNFKFYINGKLSAEFTDNLESTKRLHKGMIQLQLHDPGMIVQFKNLKIKVIK